MKKICNPFISTKRKIKKSITKKVAQTNLYKVILKDDKGISKKVIVQATNINMAVKKTVAFYSAPLRCVVGVFKVK